MKPTLKHLALLVAASCWLGSGAYGADAGIDTAIQAIQQAQDPSAAIGAYANGFAIDRNNPRLYDAYVARMVELGLPEMAYHQAQTLTTVQSDNGLGWGVIAYVDARRGQMTDAVSAINLAGQFAPNNPFVQHTAGELLAWYDFKADQTKVSQSAKDGLAKIRNLLDRYSNFTQAYSAAQKAYQTPATPASTTAPAATGQTSAEQAVPAPVYQGGAEVIAPQIQADQTPPVIYDAPLVPPTDYYRQAYPQPAYYPDSGIYMDWGPNYCSDWGPGWAAPSPWCWWEPFGYWGGCNFVPFGAAFAFGDFDDFHHFHDGFYGHDGRFGHDGHFGHDGAFAHGGALAQNGGGFWHGSTGHNQFFGAPARPSASASRWAQAGSQTRAASAFSAPSARTWNGAVQRGLPPGFGSARGGLASGYSRPGLAGSVQAPVSSGAQYWSGNSVARMVTPSHPAWNSSGYSARYYSGLGASRPAVGRSYSYGAPRYSMPARSYSGGYSTWRPSYSGRSFGGYSALQSGSAIHMGGGGFRSGGGFSSGGFRGGTFGGGGFHGGGFGGGSRGGGFSGGGGHGGGFGGGGSHGGGGHR